MSSCLAVLVCLAVATLAGASDWEYSGSHGPSHWKDANPICGSVKRQSPIDIAATTKANIPGFTFNGYGVQTGVTIKNNGHTVQVDLTNGPTITGGGLLGTFKAIQFHFHWGSVNSQGSEHTVDGKAYPVELHVVHYNTKYKSVSEAVNQTDGLAVLGVFFEVANDIDDRNHPYTAIVDALSHVKHKDQNFIISSVDLKRLLPSDNSHFYRYLGSLTTPPCYESVTWTVFRRTKLITQRQLEAFRALRFNKLGGTNEQMVDNFRPVQGLSGRIVNRNFEPVQCGDGQVECNNGKCISIHFFCNGRKGACRDGSDEGERCLDYQCRSGYRKCADNIQCVEVRKFCDEMKNCNDRSDEENCSSTSCGTHYQKCDDNSKCVPSSYWCDGYKDCDDNSDESNCKSCLPDLCLNGGTCVASRCRCLYPYAGSRCQFTKKAGYVMGDPHYRTYDGEYIVYQGPDNYILTRLKPDSGFTPFTVLAQNEYRSGYKSVTYINHVQVQCYGHIVILGRHNIVLVDGWVKQPDLHYHEFSIIRNGMHVRFQTDSAVTGYELTIEFDGDYNLYIIVSDNLKGKLEGILGNNDGDITNDYFTQNGTNVRTNWSNRDDLLCNSWAVVDSEQRKKRSADSAPTLSQPVCNNATQAIVDAYCGLMLAGEGPFRDCIASGLLNTQMLFKACMFDVCAYPTDLFQASDVACGHLQGFASNCVDKEQPPLDWRHVSGCIPNCPPGMDYKSNTTACSATCGNPNAEEECYLPNTEACVCPQGQVLMDQNTCVDVSECIIRKVQACVAVAVDISESIEESSTKEQEADIVMALWEQLTYADRLYSFELQVTLLPFNEGVLESEVKVVTTNNYTTQEQFIEQEKENMEEIQQDIRTKDTFGLTDLAPVFHRIATLQCVGKVKVGVVISDFIATKNPDKIDSALKEAENAGYKIIALGLDKERIEPIFDKVKDVSGLYVDFSTKTLGDGSLKAAVDSAFFGDEG